VVITIRARKAGDRLQITVEDDAQGAVEACPQDGVGLSNVRERLVTAFDHEASCHAGPRNGGGFRVELQLPLRFDA
jgi:two-component system, LytTR family, sensor kinase